MLYKVDIGDASFKAVVVSSKEAMTKGLSGLPKLAAGKAMLFDFNKGDHAITMNMVDMSFPIDMVFINASYEVIQVISIYPGNSTVTVDGAAYVLETGVGTASNFVGKSLDLSDELEETLSLSNEPDEKSMIAANESGISEELNNKYKKGGVIDITEKDVKADPSKMQVLDDKGVILMNIQGGERIFSIEHTEQLVAMAKKVKTGGATQEELGKLLEKIVNKHDTQKPQYTS